MEYRTLGRTGLRVSVMGFGTGGASRGGQATGRSEQESVDLIRRAFDRGVNFVDTSEAYRTEEIVGRAVRESVTAGIDRDELVISSKKLVRHEDEPISAGQFREGLDAALRRLGLDCIDVYHLHGVPASLYDHCVSELLPALERARDEGKIRATGITEAFNSDTQHATLSRAAAGGHWDVLMVGFNLLNQCARERVIAPAMEHDLGILDMFAVRRALHDHKYLREVVGRLIDAGELPLRGIDRENPLGFALGRPEVDGLTDLAYRFCRDEPGVHVVLSGTGNPAHLEANADSLEAPPLPGDLREQLVGMFQEVVSVSGQ